MNYKKLSFALTILLALTVLVACSPADNNTAAPAGDNTGAADTGTDAEPKEMRTYYMVSSHQAHPYFADSHLALRYAAEYFRNRGPIMQTSLSHDFPPSSRTGQCVKRISGILCRTTGMEPAASSEAKIRQARTLQLESQEQWPKCRELRQLL